MSTRRPLHLRGTAILAGLAVVVAGACGSGPDNRDLTVFASVSLTDAFGEIATTFSDLTGTGVTISFSASSSLAGQILAGAPADVIAMADDDAMARLGDTLDGEPVVFATNHAQIVVESGNPLGIESVADLADPAMVVVLCGTGAACGRYGAEVVERAGVTLNPVSFEENPRAVLTRVALGEADAGIVFATDIAAQSGRVMGIEIDPAINIVAEYPIAVSATAENSDDARAFIDFVLSDPGQAILARYGFGAP
jgi:molybdate transport system substrate-binding protein